MIRILPCHRGSSYHCVTWSSFLSTSVENFLRSVSKTSHISTIDPNTKADIPQYVLSTFENLFSNIFLFFSLNTFFTTWNTLFSSSMVLALAIFFTSFFYLLFTLKANHFWLSDVFIHQTRSIFLEWHFCASPLHVQVVNTFSSL